MSTATKTLELHVRYTFVFWAAVRYQDRLGGRTREFADLLIQRGHDVFFVEMPTLGNLVRNLREGGVRSVEGPRVVSSLPLPGFARLWSTPVGRMWCEYVRRHVAARIPFGRNTISLVSTPAWVPVIETMDIGTVCYDCIDHVRVHSGSKAEGVFSDWHSILLERADLVTVVSRRLGEELKESVDPDRIHLLQNGVRDDWAESANQERIPGTDQNSTRKTAGFVGAIFEWVDIALLESTAARLPDWDFVLVGPTRRGINIDTLVALPNVTWVGPKPAQEVPEWISRFDVCLIPFKQNIVADCADPIKLYEYCSLGKPVVSTVDFVADGSLGAPCFNVAGNAEAFAAAIRNSHVEESDVETLKRFGAANTWGRRVDGLVDMLEKVVSPR